ncbi:MAG: hypothetical protein Kow0060_05200 [Methylohalobius crimeensis]
MRRIGFFIIGLLWIGVQAAWGDSRDLSTKTTVLDVRHRLPQELARVIRPFLAEGEKLVAVPDGLFVQATPGRIEAIRTLLERLDRRLKSLVVTVWQTDRFNLEELNAGVDVTVGTSSERTLEAETKVYGSRADRAAGTRQRLQTLEGRPAFIAVGQERPIPVIHLYGSPPATVGGIDYQPVTTGFQVIPRTIGCRVRLTVAPWSSRPNGIGGGGLDVQSAGTTLEVELGEWIELGTHSLNESVSSRRILGHRYRTDTRRMRIFLKVDAPEGCD